MKTPQTPNDDYDSPWKEGMDLYFTEFMHFFFPEIAEDIDWDKGYEFRDKELQQVVRDAEIGKRHADKLVKVWSHDEKPFYVMIHIEVQSDRDSNFARRMYVYNYRLFDKQFLPVTSLAILADDSPSWRPNSYTLSQWGCTSQFKFPMVKLWDYADQIDSLLNSTNPFAIITAAHLKTKITKDNPQERYSWKWTITMALYQRGFSPKDILELYRLVDWLMYLPEDMNKQFTQNLIVYEEERKMPYISSAERYGREKGWDEGRDEGMLLDAREMVLEALDIKFSESNITNDIKQKITALNNRILLKKLHRSAIQSKDIEDFRNFMQSLCAES